MKHDCVPEAEESPKDEMAQHDSKVLQGHQDEVLLRNPALIEELRAVNSNVLSRHREHVVANITNDPHESKLGWDEATEELLP